MIPLVIDSAIAPRGGPRDRRYGESGEGSTYVPERSPASDRAKAERRLGWLLSAPAVIAMLLVTGYPMLNALWLSLFRYRLTDPETANSSG